MHPGMLALRSSDLAQQTTLMMWNKEMDDIMKKVKSLADAGLLMKGLNETIKNKAKEQKRWIS